MEKIMDLKKQRESTQQFLSEHTSLTRRYFLGLGAAGAAAFAGSPLLAADSNDNDVLQKAISSIETWLTKPDDFRDVSRGKPVPHSLDKETRKTVGLTRDTWSLEVISDPENKARIRTPLSKETDNPFRFADLMKLAEKHAVRFPKVMTCLNIGCPLGNGIWEGVPLRELLWLTEPRENLRRVFFYGYHNDKSDQMFRSSLPVGRVLEDPFDLPPVILCYKLNGQWLTQERGGPVRIVVPEGYGFKSIKWLSHVLLSNISHANDTYAKGNNDLDSPLKTFAATISIPGKVKPGEPFAVTGWAQAGISGLSKVQAWVHDESMELPTGDRYYQTAPWKDAKILGPPESFGGGLPDGLIQNPTMNFDPKTGRPKSWPIRLSRAHWATLIPGLAEGEYTFRCRTIDEKGHGQPMPRPFRKSGHAAIERVTIKVEA
jgi:DMSO/TMAO reductase YedYZ molybdopterin-dependent catalytic subunit